MQAEPPATIARGRPMILAIALILAGLVAACALWGSATWRERP
jgi:hypothetical protein